MNLEELKKFEPIYIIGHKNPDIDTIVSSKLLADIFNENKIESYYAILEKDYNIDLYNTKMINDCMKFNPIIIKEKEINNYNYFLVDHNNPIQSVDNNCNIIGCIDHHYNSGKINNIILTDYCATALFIYNLFKNQYKFTTKQKHQIYMAFLNDSTFGKSSRYKQKDEDLVRELNFNFNYQELFKKYFVPTNLDNGIKRVFLNGYKKYNFDGVQFESSYIEAFDTKQINEYIDLIKEYSGNFLGSWIDYSKDETFTYFKYQNNVIKYYYPFIASRATTVMNDVLKYIEQNFQCELVD